MSLLPLPENKQTEIFTRLPDRFRKPRRSAWADANKGGAEMESFLEGPSFDRAGNLYVTDIPFGRVFRISPDGEWTLITEYDGEPNGLKIHKDGRIFLADYRKGILNLDLQSGRVTPVLTSVHSEAFKGVNDLTFARNGDLYFTDQGQTGLQDPTGRVFRLRGDGGLDCLIDNGASPNGLVLNKAETHLYVAMTRANQIWRLPLHSSGLTSKVQLFHQLFGGLSGPDGMAMDEDDTLSVCHAGFGTVWVFNRLGEPLYRLCSCAGMTTTNLAYGGPERKTLFITESETGTILKAKMPVSGHPLFSHA